MNGIPHYSSLISDKLREISDLLDIKTTETMNCLTLLENITTKLQPNSYLLLGYRYGFPQYLPVTVLQLKNEDIDTLLFKLSLVSGVFKIRGITEADQDNKDVHRLYTLINKLNSAHILPADAKNQLHSKFYIDYIQPTKRFLTVIIGIPIAVSLAVISLPIVIPYVIFDKIRTARYYTALGRR